MKNKLGNQRPLDIRDVRKSLGPSIIGVLLIGPALLLLAGLGLQVMSKASVPGMLPAIAIGLGGAGVGLALATMFGGPSEMGR